MNANAEMISNDALESIESKSRPLGFWTHDGPLQSSAVYAQPNLLFAVGQMPHKVRSSNGVSFGVMIPTKMWYLTAILAPSCSAHMPDCSYKGCKKSKARCIDHYWMCSGSDVFQKKKCTVNVLRGGQIEPCGKSESTVN